MTTLSLEIGSRWKNSTRRRSGLKGQDDSGEPAGIGTGEGVACGNALPISVETGGRGGLVGRPCDEIARELNRVREAADTGCLAADKLNLKDAAGDVGEKAGGGQSVGSSWSEWASILDQWIQVVRKLVEIGCAISVRIRIRGIV